MRKITLSLFVFLVPFSLLTALSLSAEAQEPALPPDTAQPRALVVELKEKATLRMGDTVTLKGTDFSAKLVGFREPMCPGPKTNCASMHPIPEFQYTNGTTVCDPNVKKPRQLSAKPADRDCVKKLPYRLHHDPVEDRAAVVIEIKNRKKGR